MKDFELLKRTYPVSRYDRLCDGYDYIIKNSTEEERKGHRSPTLRQRHGSHGGML